jgi:hypothetical protein
MPTPDADTKEPPVKARKLSPSGSPLPVPNETTPASESASNKIDVNEAGLKVSSPTAAAASASESASIAQSATASSMDVTDDAKSVNVNQNSGDLLVAQEQGALAGEAICTEVTPTAPGSNDGAQAKEQTTASVAAAGTSATTSSVTAVETSSGIDPATSGSIIAPTESADKLTLASGGTVVTAEVNATASATTAVAPPQASEAPSVTDAMDVDETPK